MASHSNLVNSKLETGAGKAENQFRTSPAIVQTLKLRDFCSFYGKKSFLVKKKDRRKRGKICGKKDSASRRERPKITAAAAKNQQKTGEKPRLSAAKVPVKVPV